ncbi:hypothetical protein [Helicobacter pylori]|uniref:hypothetical protein n=1 Tax=Helicobacter pylori TaxID=210 RepID=UPI0036F24FE6
MKKTIRVLSRKTTDFQTPNPPIKKLKNAKKHFLQSIIKELAEFEIFFKMSFKMTKQSNQKPVFKNKSFSITEPKIA